MPESSAPPKAPSGRPAGPKTLTREQFLHFEQLRHRALDLLNRCGEWQEIEGYPGRLRGYSSGALFMLHRTPFQPPPISEAAVEAGISPQAQRQAQRGFGLDIWQDNRKVLSTIWNEAEQPAIVYCRRGPWEAELTEAHRQRS